MDISELYKLFLKHPVVTTDSRDCPKNSIFLPEKELRLMVTSLQVAP